MWEIIRANQRKSIILFIGMALCLMALGYLVGAVFFPPDGGISGLFIAIAVWIILSLVSLTAGSSIFLSLSHARPVTHDVHPQLYNITEEMRISANLPAMPKLYIMEEAAPNAFAVGINPSKSAIAVTTGLLARLNRDELQGVIAHEMGHIINRDSKFLTLAGILLGSITLVSEVFLRGLFYSGRSRRYSSRRSEGGNQIQMVLMIVAIVFAILAPILAQLLYFAISRKREYLADATSARLTRYPEGLASALEKISGSTSELSVANKITAPMYIINPLKKKGMALSNFSSTHPPIQERVQILRGMMGGAAYKNYQAAYAKMHKSQRIVPASAIKENEFVSVRQPSPKAKEAPTQKTQLRDIGDLTRAMNGFIFAPCVCGLKVKVPPNFKKSQINCPRCKRVLDIPLPEIMGLGTIGAAVEQAQQHGRREQAFTRKTKGWESVRCSSCGNLMQLSPMFAGTHMTCPKCESTIQIQS